MTVTPSHRGATPRVAVDWVYIRTRTLVLGGLLLVGLVGAGAWWWMAGGAVPAEERAAQAIASAEQVIAAAHSRWGESPPLTRAQKHLARARELYVNDSYGTSLQEAQAAETLAREVLEGRSSANETSVRISRVDGDVRIKRSGQFMWESATERSMLSMGDQIRTGNRGSAQLVFFDGTMMTVRPGTLLEIRELFRDNQKHVQRVSERLAWGSLHASTNETEGVESVHEVSTASAAVRARQSSEFRVSHDRERGTSEFVSLEGELSLQTGDREVVLPERTRVSTSKGEIVETAKILAPPLLKAPSDARTFLATQKGSIELLWFQVRGAEYYQLQISRHPTFSNIEFEQEGLRDARSSLPALPPGKYYWHVAAVDGDGYPGRWSDTRRFRVLGEKFRDPDDTEPPPLKISEILVVGSNAIISGYSEPGALVWIGGERVDVNDDGKFTWVIKLHHDGENKIRFQAQDAAGNETNQVGYAYVDVF